MSFWIFIDSACCSFKKRKLLICFLLAGGPIDHVHGGRFAGGRGDAGAGRHDGQVVGQGRRPRPQPRPLRRHLQPQRRSGPVRPILPSFTEFYRILPCILCVF